MTREVKVKSGFIRIIILAIAFTFILPTMILGEGGSTPVVQELQRDDGQKLLAPVLPFELYGQIYIDNVLLSTTDYTLMTLVNDTVFGKAIPGAGGWFNIDTYGDHTETPEVREGGWNGDLIYYLMKKNDGVPGRRWMCADETFIFTVGGFSNSNLHFSSTGSPWPLKISSLTPNPTAGNDLVTIYNPSNESVDLTNWLLRDRDEMNMALTGRNIPPYSEISVDLGADVLSGLADGGPMSGDEIALCWRDPMGVMGDGEWIAMDQVEYGNQNDYRDNTTLWDYPVTPTTEFRLVRSPDLFTDTDNCTLDFIIEEVDAETPQFVDIPLETGWNLVSFPIIPVNASAESIFAPILSNLVSVKAYDPYDLLDRWKSYRPGSSTNDLHALDNTIGFWVKVNGTCTLHIEGSEPTNSSIPLKAGWNLVGYPSMTSRSVSIALAGTGFDRPVECYDAMSPCYLKQMGNGDLMNVNNGYWIHVPADTLWTMEYITSIPDPYPVFGFVYLYDGTSAGGYEPLLSYGGASVEIKWWNPAVGWDIVNTGTEPSGQYYSQIVNYIEGGVIFINATFDAPYGNRGYNYTYIDTMMGCSFQNVVCGVPYSVLMMQPAFPQPIISGMPFPAEYWIVDCDWDLAQGYFTFSDGPFEWFAIDGGFLPPPPRFFEGTSDFTPGVGMEMLTLYEIGETYMDVVEGPMGGNNYLTPWGEFYIDPNHTWPIWGEGWGDDAAFTIVEVIA